ncbi:MAG: hypothetical protein R8L58_04405 [Mariprofundaceae bacterium]
MPLYQDISEVIRQARGHVQQAAAKVTVAIARLEMGNTSRVKWFSGIGEDRIDWGPGYRIYLLQDGKDLIVLFGGGSKKSQQQDISKALVLCSEYKARKKGGTPWRG